MIVRQTAPSHDTSHVTTAMKYFYQLSGAQADAGITLR